MSISRRVFVKSGGLALFSFGLDPLFLARAALSSYEPLPSHAACCRPVLVCLFQRGAVDGLNMIVHHGDPIYYQERPRIAVPEKDVLDLDGYFGLHPGLAALKPLWEAKTLAAIHAIGSPDATRSHFDAQDYMESGTPGVKATPDGWLNRYCQHDREHQDTPFRAVAFGPQLPRILAGTAPSLAIDDLQAFGLRAPQPAARDRVALDLLSGSVRRGADAQAPGPRTVPARERCRLPARQAGKSAARDRPAHQGRYRAPGGVRGRDRVGHARKSGSDGGAVGGAVGRAGRSSRGLHARRGRADARRRRAHDVRVRSHRTGKRQLGHRSRARDGHAGAGRPSERRQGPGQVARTRSRAALRGPGRGRDHRLPRSIRRAPGAPPGGARPVRGLPGIRCELRAIPWRDPRVNPRIRRGSLLPAPRATAPAPRSRLPAREAHALRW